MYCTKNITDDLFWIGGNDRRLALFENIFPVPNGVSYNSYVLLDEKTVLLDTVDKAVSEQFFENLVHVLGERTLDYVIINHMEPDHCAMLKEVIMRYPDVQIVCNAKTADIIKQFFKIETDAVIVKEHDTLSTGKHTFTFLMAPMVHWPEVMVTYDVTDKILFSADAFGTFGAINGNLFADEIEFEHKWLDDARRYYTNIVGKYGAQVQALLKKASQVEIEMICPLHGPVWRTDLAWFIEKYQKWSTYEPEDQGLMIAYASIYGNTENAVNVLASRLADKGLKNIAVYDVSVTHPSVVVSEAFRASHLVFASPTYNGGIFPNMETVLLDLKAHNLQKRTVAFMQNGTWAATSARQMNELISGMKEMTVLEPAITIKSALNDSQSEEIDAMVDAILDSMDGSQNPDKQ